jgi:hypothetical protein
MRSQSCACFLFAGLIAALLSALGETKPTLAAKKVFHLSQRVP